MAERTATPPTTGSLRDLVIGFVVGTTGAWVTQQTGSPELGESASQAAGQVSAVIVGAATAVALAAVTFARKWAMDRLTAG